MPFERGGKTWDVPEILAVGSYLGLLGICKLCSWPATYSGLWNQIICSQGAIYSLEYRNTFRRVKLWVEFMKQRGGVVFLNSRGCISWHSYREHPLLKKHRRVWVLELAWKEQNLINFSLILLPWLVRAREFTFINMEVILNALGRK